MELFNSAFGLLWVLWVVFLGYVILALKLYNKHIKPRTLKVMIALLSLLILISNVGCAYYESTLLVGSFFKICVLCVASCLIGFACLIRCFSFLKPNTLDKNKIYRFKPEGFWYVGKPGNYRLYLKGRIVDGTWSCHAFILSNQVFQKVPCLDVSQTLLCQKVGVFLPDYAQKCLKRGELSLYVCIDGYQHYAEIEGAKVIPIVL